MRLVSQISLRLVGYIPTKTTRVFLPFPFCPVAQGAVTTRQWILASAFSYFISPNWRHCADVTVRLPLIGCGSFVRMAFG